MERSSDRGSTPLRSTQKKAKPDHRVRLCYMGELIMKKKVAVFDSGLGGISVLRELVKVLPEEDFIYFGDSANAPYGVRTREDIQNLCDNVIHKIISEEGSIKCVVIACNTATSAAIDHLRKTFPEIKFIGIEPAIEWAANDLDHPTVLTFATDFTVNGDLFKNNVKRLSDKAKFISMGAPEFVKFVESGVNDRTGSEECIQYIDKLCEEIHEPVEAIVLGCTHFPFIREMIRKEVGKKLSCDPKLYDAAVLVADKTRKWLDDKGIREKDGKGTVKMMNSDPEKIDFMWELYES